MRIYSVEGAVGAGKSTFMRLLSELRDADEAAQSRMLLVLEPVDLWMLNRENNNNNTNLGPLQAQYRYPTIYGPMFQMYAFMSYLAIIGGALFMHRNQYGNFPDMVFVERFPGFANYHVFMQALLDGGFVDDLTMRMAEYIFDMANQLEFIRLWLGLEEPIQTEFIYVTANVETTIARVAERGRERVDDGRLRRIHSRYELWLGGGRNTWFDLSSMRSFDVRVVANEGEINSMRREAESLFAAEQVRPAVVDPIMGAE